MCPPGAVAAADGTGWAIGTASCTGATMCCCCVAGNTWGMLAGTTGGAGTDSCCCGVKAGLCNLENEKRHNVQFERNLQKS